MTKFSPPNQFLFAKMHVALADAQSHEFVHHFVVHLMMESVAIARNNYLSKTRSSIGIIIKEYFFRISFHREDTGAFLTRNNSDQLLWSPHSDTGT